VNDGKIGGEGLTKADEVIVRQLRMEGKGEGFQATPQATQQMLLPDCHKFH